MQIKEDCDRTGLSRRTIRYYEEERLIAPAKEVRRGRTYRNYSETDIQQLQRAAALRKAWFSVGEIKTMQQEPDEISSVEVRTESCPGPEGQLTWEYNFFLHSDKTLCFLRFR